MSKQIEQIRAEVERRISKNTFGAKLELIDILAWLDQLPAQPIPSDVQKAADKYIGYPPEVDEGVSTSLRRDAYAAGMLAERERLASCPTIKGWVARDGNGDAYLYPYYRPTRDKRMWFGMTGFFLKCDPFPSLRWEDEPIEVELPIIRK